MEFTWLQVNYEVERMGRLYIITYLYKFIYVIYICIYSVLYNIYNEGEATFIDIAVTGFKKKELKCYFNDEGLFVVEGTRTKEDTPDRKYFQRNLSTKNFQRKFSIPKNTELDSVEVQNGLMTIKFVRVQPDIKYIDIK